MTSTPLDARPGGWSSTTPDWCRARRWPRRLRASGVAVHPGVRRALRRRRWSPTSSPWALCCNRRRICPPRRSRKPFRRAPERFRELNVAAFHLGLGLASESAEGALSIAAIAVYALVIHRRTGALRSMDLLEHQGKTLFGQAGLPTLPSPGVDRGRCRARRCEVGLPVVVKAQVKTGGRGKAGGVRLCRHRRGGRCGGGRGASMTIRPSR